MQAVCANKSVSSPMLFKHLLSETSRLIAILDVEQLSYATPLLEVLEEAGIKTIEVTLRSSCALGVIETMAANAKEAVVGAGTLTRPEQFVTSRDAGAQFVVSPAFSPSLAGAADEVGLPFLPGATTPTEVLVAREYGYCELKCFPSDLNGGLRWLQHMAPLFPDVSFCPTGGITNGNVFETLRQPNVFAAGGMYMAPKQLVAAADWKAVKAVAEGAVRAAAS